MQVIDLLRNLIVLQAQVKKGLVTTVTVALLIFCWLMFMAPVPAQAAYSTLTYHLHGEPSLINGANRQLLLSDPNTATTRIQGPRLNTTGEKAIANFETQLGDPNWTGTIPAGTNWTFDVWYSLSAIGSAVAYPRVSVYLNNTVGPPILTATSTVRIANNTTPSLYGWTGNNASAISVTPGDRLFIVVAVNCTAVGSGNQRIQLNIEGLAGGQTDSTIIAPIDESIPQTILTTAPVSADGANGWFKTEPSITLTRDEAGTTYYSWVSATGPWTSYSVPFNAISGINTLYYYSEDASGNVEDVKSQALKVDTDLPSSSVTAPTEGTRLRGASYAVTGTAIETGVSGLSLIEVSINGEAWQPASGTSSWTYAWTLGADGSYTIRSRASDLAGNIETPGTGVTVTVDNTAPTVSSIVPVSGAINVDVGANITTTFDEPMDAATITRTTFTLKDYLNNPVSGEVTYDAPSRTASFNPDANLASTTNYTATITAEVKDMTGNALAADQTWSFTSQDIIAPVTTLSSIPLSPDGTNDWFKTVPQITLTRNEPGATYYSWDSPTGPWTTYEAPFAAISGINTMYYYSEDSAGNQEQGRSQELKVDHVSPATVISDPADGAKLRGSAYTITGTASDSGASAIISIEVAINDGPWQMASGTQDWILVWALGSDGPYNIKSRATDDAGNVEVAGAGTNVAVDNTPPQIIETTPAPSRYYESLVRIKDIQGTNHYEGNQTCGVCHGSDTAMPGHELGGDHVSEFTGVAAHDLRIDEPDSGTKIKCSNCHEPHGSMFARLTFFDEEELCFQCHNSANLPNSKNGADIQAEFQKTSHHLVKSNDEQTKIECSSCHGPHTVRDQAGQILTNPDNTKAIHSGTKTSFCLKCHDGDPPQEVASSGRVVPYSVKFPVMTNKLFPGWDKLGFVLYPSAMSTVAECSTCHSNHGSGNLRLQSFMGDDSQAYAEEGLCLTCHRTGNPNQAPDIATLLQKSFKHPVDDVNGRHADDESGKSLSYSSDSSSRHSECVDCHDPHEAMSGEAPRPQVKAANNGASGTDRNGQPLSSAGYEYEICFKCHSSFSQRLPGTDDVSSEFDSTNASYHPVASIGANQGIDVSAFVTPWDTNQQLYCSDCHGNDAAGEARCLAGSGNRFMLRDAYGGGQIDLCLKCHNAEAYLTSGMPGSRWLGHNVSTGHSDCSLCHDSHGSRQEHLINRGYFHYQNGGILVTNSSCAGADCHINGEWKSYLTVY